MNKIAILAGALGIAAGGVGGYLVCHFVEKKKIDKAISDGVQQTLEEIRGKQRSKIMENENKKSEMIKTTGRNINSIPHINANDIVSEIVADNGYKGSSDSKSSEDSQGSRDEKEPDGEPDSDDDGLPFEMTEKHNIWDEEEPDEDSLTQEEYDAEQEPEIPVDIQNLDPTKKPYPITQDQWANDFEEECAEGFWDKVTLIFFTDNVFAERARFNEYETMSSKEVEAAIGKDNMKSFIEDRSLGRIFVRNNKIKSDFEIVRSPRSYSSALHEEDDED